MLTGIYIKVENDLHLHNVPKKQIPLNLDLLQVVGKKYNIFPNWWWAIGIYHGRIRKNMTKKLNSRNMVVPLGWWYTLSKMVKLVNQATKNGAWTSYSSPSMYLLRRYWKPLSQATQNQVDWSTRGKTSGQFVAWTCFFFPAISESNSNCWGWGR